MDLPKSVQNTTFTKIKSAICDATKKVQDKSMSQAAKEEFKDAEGYNIRSCDISCDGTWMTRGRSSKIGVTSVIGCSTGKVLDTETLSKVCKSCQHYEKLDKESDAYKNRPQHECTLTHIGSSGLMESNSAVSMFKRSVTRHNLIYERFIGDGDSSSFKKVMESKPYGDDFPITKIECVGHVQKRMGARLRKLKTTKKGQKLSDGKPIGGRNQLTDAMIDKLQIYYGNAIRGNKQNLVEMRKAVWAVLYHKQSTDDNPQHQFCKKEWCPYLKAEDQKTAFVHKDNLPEAVCEEIRPIFKDLAKTELLVKCLEGYTQNANESLNGIIWKFAPKRKNHGLITVKSAVSLAVSLYNDGAKTFLNILDELGLSAGYYSKQFAKTQDISRVYSARRKADYATHEARRARRRCRLQQDEKQMEVEEFPYDAGAHT